MKIKPTLLTKEDVQNGFNYKTEYKVDKIEVVGDCQAYDIWFHITNEIGNSLWIQDLYNKNIITDDNILSLLDGINDLVTKSKAMYKFKFEIDTEEE
ncbi:hypothetical protein [Clostridium butyricum]|uniref:hypothetical protein n=1 Tax=Clostridium butyricum TaxID=1492 RepID=UPI00325B0919